MSEKTPGSQHEVRIHIDQKPYYSPNPTTGEALYALSHVPKDLVLYREVRGDHEDPAIKNGPEIVHLKEDEHFHSGSSKGITIIVTGTPHEWFKPQIDYTEVVTFFDPAYPKHPDWTYSVTYKHGPSGNPQGILAPGDKPVKIKERMEFNVKCTGQS